MKKSLATEVPLTAPENSTTEAESFSLFSSLFVFNPAARSEGLSATSTVEAVKTGHPLAAEAAADVESFSLLNSLDVFDPATRSEGLGVTSKVEEAIVLFGTAAGAGAAESVRFDETPFPEVDADSL
ncbi:uncharacterized protein [Euphorbia lathyris]|uniref:uncharacterized protein n=1 Tax=Euphorbia lathyris TaxID=212925 RepID=UPI003314492C